jgi:exodeoxyribonuclease VII large subunit
MEVLNTRKSQFGISTFLFNCTLQGDPAVDSMVNTLEKIQRISHHFDAVAIIRGGGAEVGMSCYDDYRLCRAIAEFPLPVLCGIGHSTNLTVAEMVANHHEITPSMLATSLLRIFEEKLTALNNAKERILAHRDFFMRSVQKTIGIKSLEISRLSRIRVEKEWRVLESLGLKMNKNSRAQTSYHSHSLLQTPKDISRNIRFKLEREGLDILALLRSSINSSKTLSNSACNSLDSLEKTMAILDPKSVLARGYSIARKNNEVVKTSETLHKGDVVEIEFYQGKKATKVI